jgi:hypothetical protein
MPHERINNAIVCIWVGHAALHSVGSLARHCEYDGNEKRRFTIEVLIDRLLRRFGTSRDVVDADPFVAVLKKQRLRRRQDRDTSLRRPF